MRRAAERSEQTAKELAALDAWRRSALVLFASTLLLVTVVVAVAIGSRRVTTDATQDLAQAEITPQSLPTVPADARATPDATVTPTPRVVVVAEPTPTPRPRSVATPSARSIASAPAGIALATATPSPRASPAGTPPPPAISTATVTATQASSAAGSAAVIPAASWKGAYRPRDTLHFARPWVAIYGSLSVYSRAAAFVQMDAAPTGPATLTLTGIDDEWLDLNPIAVRVNGQQVFSGASPFANWDGATTSAAEAWTRVTITIAPELLEVGRNRITVANLSPTGNVGSPPYVLLGDASLQAPGATAIVLAPEPDAQPADSGQEGGQGDDDGANS
jgi:hypothetical protein